MNLYTIQLALGPKKIHESFIFFGVGLKKSTKGLLEEDNEKGVSIVLGLGAFKKREIVCGSKIFWDVIYLRLENPVTQNQKG